MQVVAPWTAVGSRRWRDLSLCFTWPYVHSRPCQEREWACKKDDNDDDDDDDDDDDNDDDNDDDDDDDDDDVE